MKKLSLALLICLSAQVAKPVPPVASSRMSKKEISTLLLTGSSICATLYFMDKYEAKKNLILISGAIPSFFTGALLAKYQNSRYTKAMYQNFETLRAIKDQTEAEAFIAQWKKQDKGMNLSKLDLLKHWHTLKRTK